MEAAKAILARRGIASIGMMDVNETITIQVQEFEDLTIEKVGPTRVSVAHHYVQRGDLMSDPEIVFRVDNGAWIPIRFTHHPNVHRYDRTGLELHGFVEKWSRNLHRQGFVEAAAELGELR